MYIWYGIGRENSAGAQRQLTNPVEPDGDNGPEDVIEMDGRRPHSGGELNNSKDNDLDTLVVSLLVSKRLVAHLKIVKYLTRSCGYRPYSPA